MLSSLPVSVPEMGMHRPRETMSSLQETGARAGTGFPSVLTPSAVVHLFFSTTLWLKSQLHGPWNYLRFINTHEINGFF